MADHLFVSRGTLQRDVPVARSIASNVLPLVPRYATPSATDGVRSPLPASSAVQRTSPVRASSATSFGASHVTSSSPDASAGVRLPTRQSTEWDHTSTGSDTGPGPGLTPVRPG